MLPQRPTRTTLDLAALYAAAAESRQALLDYLADARVLLADLQANVDAAAQDLASCEQDMLRFLPDRAASLGITPPAAPAPVASAPARPAPKPETLVHRPTLKACTRKMALRQPTGNLAAPALCMLLASVDAVYAHVGDASPADWGFADGISRAEADAHARRRWHASGMDTSELDAFALACYRLAVDKQERITPRDVLLALMPGTDVTDIAVAVAPAFAAPVA